MKEQILSFINSGYFGYSRELVQSMNGSWLKRFWSERGQVLKIWFQCVLKNRTVYEYPQKTKEHYSKQGVGAECERNTDLRRFGQKQQVLNIWFPCVLKNCTVCEYRQKNKEHYSRELVQSVKGTLT